MDICRLAISCLFTLPDRYCADSRCPHVDGIVGVAYGKKLNERRYLAFFTYVLLLGVLSLPLFLLFCCYGLKQFT